MSNPSSVREGMRLRVSRPKFRAALDRAPFEGVVYKLEDTDLLVVNDNDGLPVIVQDSKGRVTTFPIVVLP